MTIYIVENATDGNDDIDLCKLHNIDIVPSKGDELALNGKLYKVDGFLWHIENGHIDAVTIYVDFYKPLH